MTKAEGKIKEGIYPKNAEAAVNSWDKGESVWSIEMGGIGPGYEQAIQVLVIELLRSLVKKEVAGLEDGDLQELFKDEAHHIVKDSGGGLTGLSGGQVGAATQLAYKFLTTGWLVMDEVPDDRHILVSKWWPRCEPQEIGLSS